MKTSICGANCSQCPSNEICAGCTETCGQPFGKRCFVANYILTRGEKSYRDFTDALINEVNALEIDGMEKVTALYPLVGSFVNLEYPLPSGATVKLLRDDEIYLGAQVADLHDNSRKSCFGVIGREDFLIICEYGENCADPKLVIFKKREAETTHE